MPAEAHKVKIGTTTYSLFYGTKALRVFERESGQLAADLNGKTFGIGTIAHLLHAGMLDEYPDMEIEDVDEMLDKFLADGGEILPIMKTVSKAISKSGWFTVNPTKGSASTKGSGAKPAEQE